MKRKVLLQMGAIALIAAALLTACGSSTGGADTVASQNTSSAAYDTGGGMFSSDAVAFDIAEAEEMPEEYDMESGEGAINGQQDALAGRKLIKTLDLNVETEQFDILMPALEQRVTALGGYIENMSSYNRGDNYSPDYVGTRYLRYANMTVRIPKENLDAFLSTVAEQTNVVSRSESVTDVTLQYVDLESHKKALATEQDRLLELMEQAETVEDIITIEGRLSEVRYQLESMESQLRTYDNKIDYSTVYLSVDEVEQYTPTETTTVGQRISSGFMGSLRDIGQDICNFAIWLLVNLPYLIVWTAVIVVIFLIYRIVHKNAAKRRAMKLPMQGDAYAAQDTQWEQQADGGSVKSDNMKDKHTES